MRYFDDIGTRVVHTYQVNTFYHLQINSLKYVTVSVSFSLSPPPLTPPENVQMAKHGESLNSRSPIHLMQIN